MVGCKVCSLEGCCVVSQPFIPSNREERVMAARPPPKAPIPLSTEEMAIIKKKVAPPKGPPPAGFANFKAPKKYEEDNENHYSHKSERDTRYNDESDEENNNQESGGGKRRQTPRYYEDESDHKMNPAQQQRRYDEDEIENENDRNNYPSSNYQQYPSSSRNSKKTPTSHDDDDENEYSSSNRDHHHNEVKQPPPSARDRGLPPRLKIFNYKKILRSSFKDLKLFVTTPCDVNTIVRCYIERNRSGSNYLTPVYSLCADLEDGTGRELISCRKFFKSKTAYYIFSLKSEDLYRKREQRGRYYLGKLRAITNDTYVMYDNGVCDTMRGNTGTDTVDEVTIDDLDDDQAKESSRGHEYDENSLYRSQLVVIKYNTKIRPVEEGQRGMEVCIPLVTTGADPSQVTKHADMVSSFEKIQKSGRQNDLFGNKYVIIHEKRSRLYFNNLHSLLILTL